MKIIVFENSKHFEKEILVNTAAEIIWMEEACDYDDINQTVEYDGHRFYANYWTYVQDDNIDADRLFNELKEKIDIVNQNRLMQERNEILTDIRELNERLKKIEAEIRFDT